MSALAQPRIWRTTPFFAVRDYVQYIRNFPQHLELVSYNRSQDTACRSDIRINKLIVEIADRTSTYTEFITFFIFFITGGVGLSPWYCGHFGLLYKPQMIDEDDFWSNWWNENWQGKPKCSEKTYPSATLTTTKSHMTDPVSNPGPPRWEASD
jgi:hypothetical protein